jgi:hypothetical protein
MRRTVVLIAACLAIGALVGHSYHTGAANAAPRDDITGLREQVVVLNARVGNLNRRLRTVESRGENICRLGHVVVSVAQADASSPASVGYVNC